MTSRGRHAVATRRDPLLGLLTVWELRSTLVTALLGAGAAALLVAAALVVSLRVSTHPVLTGSMRGTFDPGALVITRQVPVASVEPGDVVVFTPPGASTPFTHRVVTVSGDARHPVITTKGDANPAPDPWRAQLTQDAVPQVVASVPVAGQLLLAVSGPRAHALLVGLLGTVIAVAGTRLLLGTERRPQPRSRTA